MATGSVAESLFTASKSEWTSKDKSNSRQSRVDNIHRSRLSHSPSRSTSSPRSKTRPAPSGVQAQARVRSNPESVARQLFASEASSSNDAALPFSSQLQRRGADDKSLNTQLRQHARNGVRHVERVRKAVVKGASEAVAAHPQMELTAKRLVSGAFAGVVSRTAVAPLDVAKLKFMLEKPAQGANATVLNVLSRTFKEEGVKGLFRGNGLNCVRVAPGKAIELCTFETVRALTGRAEIAGGVAGALNTLATYPLEVLRTRCALDQRAAKGGIGRALKRIARKEGVSAVYRGCAFSVVGVVPYTAAQYLVYDGLCRGYHMTKKQDPATSQVPGGLTLMFGSVAAMVASAATFPMEVYRRQLQLTGGTNAAAVGAIRDMVRVGGPAGLYRGLGASCLKLGPAAGVSFLCYELAKSALNVGVDNQAPPPLEGREDHPVESPVHRLHHLPSRALAAEADLAVVAEAKAAPSSNASLCYA